MEKAIIELMEKIKKNKFAFIGSAALWLRGVDIKLDDIDIITDDKGVEKIAEIFNSNLEKKRGFVETYFEINKFPIQALSYQNNPVRKFDFDNELEWIDKFNQKIPCMSLKSELAVYQELGREEDKKTIEIITNLLE